MGRATCKHLGCDQQVGDNSLVPYCVQCWMAKMMLPLSEFVADGQVDQYMQDLGEFQAYKDSL